VLFCPSLVGVSSCGLSSCIGSVICGVGVGVSASAVGSMCSRVFVTGGGSLYPGLLSRVESIVTCHAPFNITPKVQVYHARDPVLDAWRGATHAAQQSVQKHITTQHTTYTNNIYQPT